MSAKPPKSAAGAWCSRHRPSKHESQLSHLNRVRVQWYRRERARLIAALGGKCVECGTTEELEFDETGERPAGMPAPNRTSRWQRLRNYLKMHALGRLALRCRTCNAKGGTPARNGDPF